MAKKKERVRCIDCRHINRQYLYYPAAYCEKNPATENMFDPIHGEYVKTTQEKCIDKNAKGYCKDFERKPPAQPVDIESELWPALRDVPTYIYLRPGERVVDSDGRTLASYDHRPWWKFWD